MTDMPVPPMVRSALERAAHLNTMTREDYLLIATEIELAYQDGFAAGVQAERARWTASQPESKRLHSAAERASIIAALKEPR